MPRYVEGSLGKDKCWNCERPYTDERVKWWICSMIDCNKDSVKWAACSECVVKFRINKKIKNCHCSSKILAESWVISVEELNSKDSWLLWHKDSVKEEWQL